MSSAKRFSEVDMIQGILSVINEHANPEIELETYNGDKMTVQNIQSFSEAGLLTQNDGLVITLENGQEFYLTVTVK